MASGNYLCVTILRAGSGLVLAVAVAGCSSLKFSDLDSVTCGQIKTADDREAIASKIYSQFMQDQVKDPKATVVRVAEQENLAARGPGELVAGPALAGPSWRGRRAAQQPHSRVGPGGVPHHGGRVGDVDHARVICERETRGMR